MINLKKEKLSIKTRMLFSVVFLISIILLGVWVSFNLIVYKYIKSNANEELKKATKIVQFVDDKYIPIKPPPESEHSHTNFSGFMRSIQEKVKMTQMESNAEAMVVSSDYELLFPKLNEEFFKDTSAMQYIINELKDKNINLESKDLEPYKNSRISTEYGDYYISIVKVTSLDSDEEQYLILYIDISKTLNLARKINNVLIIVILVAEILAIFTALILSEKIAKPIRQLSGFAKKIGEGNFKKYYFDFTDKELDELAKVMNKSADCLDKYDNEQKMFFQNVSHELRTPLMSVKGYAEAIKYDVMEKEKAIEVILEESDRLSEMVEDLLYISKIDNITRDYKLIDSDIREIISNCTSRQNVRAMNKGINFKYDFDENPILFKCDEKHIARVFLNLLENALRYSKEEINISCKAHDEKIFISIEDDGDGIAMEDMPYIFDRFYKGHDGKHGIGLSLVKSIVNKHGGRIYAENTSKGAKFTIVFNKEDL